MRGAGVLIGRTGRRDSTLKIRPPLAFLPRHADILVATLEEVLHGLGRDVATKRRPVN
jgi:4-aminobutyrate aminotransferase-like enzyme